MSMKCCILSCRSNYEGTTEYVPVFSFPDKDKEPDLRRRWKMFVNRVNWESDDSSAVCKKTLRAEIHEDRQRRKTISFNKEFKTCSNNF